MTCFPFRIGPALLALALLSAPAAQAADNPLDPPAAAPDSAATPDASTVAAPAPTLSPTGAILVPQPATIAVATPYNLWDRIREGFGLDPLPDESLMARHIAWFSARPDYVERTVDRSRRYLYFIVEEVQRRGMPTEIALLPIVESAFNPHALSRSQASGMWQFIPSTGRLYGLKQDWWYDGRKDVIAATNSALDYLQKLHDEFGSWELALAGYNCGEGKIRREIAYNSARNRPTDYQSLNLPDETRNYVPKLMAAKAIVLDPERYGLKLAPIPDEPFFAAVTTQKRLDTKVAAQFAEMSVDDFLMLNPGFNRPVISLNFNQEQTILVPTEVADRFVAKLADPQVKLVSWKTHHLKRGEPLDKVAQQFGLSSDELKRINGIASNKRVAGGGTILVPDKSGSAVAAPLEIEGKPESEIPAPGPLRIKTEKGDTLPALAEKYGTTVALLERWNHLKHGHKLKPGQSLIVQQGEAVAKAKPPAHGKGKKKKLASAAH